MAFHVASVGRKILASPRRQISVLVPPLVRAAHSALSLSLARTRERFTGRTGFGGDCRGFRHEPTLRTWDEWRRTNAQRRRIGEFVGQTNTCPSTRSENPPLNRRVGDEERSVADEIRAAFPAARENNPLARLHSVPVQRHFTAANPIRGMINVPSVKRISSRI